MFLGHSVLLYYVMSDTPGIFRLPRWGRISAYFSSYRRVRSIRVISPKAPVQSARLASLTKLANVAPYLRSPKIFFFYYISLFVGHGRRTANSRRPCVTVKWLSRGKSGLRGDRVGRGVERQPVYVSDHVLDYVTDDRRTEYRQTSTL